MTSITDSISIFLLNNNKQELSSDIITKFNTVFTQCKAEGDEFWKEFITYFNDATNALKGPGRTAFFRSLYPKLRGFLNSGFSESNVRDGTSGGETSHGGDIPKKFKVNAKCFHLTYDNTQDISIDNFMKQIFTIFNGRIKKWAVADDIAPSTGMIHYHLYLELYEAWKVLDARSKFTVIDDKNVKLVPNIKTGAGTKEAIAYIAKKEVYKTNMDMNYEVKTKKMHQQLLAYELLHKKMNMTEAVEMYPELLFKYDSTKSNLNSYFTDKEKDNTPEMPLSTWNMFGIQTWFSGKGKTPQYWIVGPSNVGKTYNIDMLEEVGHRPYLMPKNNDWSDWSDKDYDFMYNEETAADFSLTFLNQMLEGTRTKLNGKFVKSIIKKKNVPIILNSNHMPHMIYKNTDPYTLNATLQRMYIIYVDSNKNGHIIWNPNTMNVEQYISKFINGQYPMDSYDNLFGNEYENESSNDKSYIKYLTTIQAEKEEADRILKLRNEAIETMEQAERAADTLDSRIERTLDRSASLEKVERWFKGGYDYEDGYSSDDSIAENNYVPDVQQDDYKVPENQLHLEPVVCDSDSEYDRYGVPKDDAYQEMYGFSIDERHLHNKVYAIEQESEPDISPPPDILYEECLILGNMDMNGLFNGNETKTETDIVDMKFNMGVCLETDCGNRAVQYEDLCQYHIDEQCSDTDSIVIVEYDRYKCDLNYLNKPNYYGGLLKFEYKGVMYNK